MHPIRCAIFGALAALLLAGPAVADSISAGVNVPMTVNPQAYTQILFQGFNPALGTLRCVKVTMGAEYQVAGTLELKGSPFCGGVSGPGTATYCVGGSVGIGGFDGTGFSATASAGRCDFVTGSIGQGVRFATVPFVVSGLALNTTLVTNPARMAGYIGAGLVSPYLARGVIEDEVSVTGPCISSGVSIGNWSVGTSISVAYIFTPVFVCHGDTNHDGRVDFLDLNTVLASYAQVGQCWAGDTNNDGVVNFLDLNDVLSSYGQTCAADDQVASLTPPPFPGSH